ncbi:MAG: putative ribosomal RNA small subunit methyltransferase A [Candidatus Micrarchaeota archaeon]|nr:MAG: putative ribosomal RNA small subunit methyltransferase A [Candidatus Micrarchaeota archaeon]
MDQKLYDYLVRSFSSNKRYGQNFLISERIAEAEAAHSEGKIVLEVGPGLGFLTERLCKYSKKVIAIEKDKRLYSILKMYMSNISNLELIHGDIFEIDESIIKEVDIVIANLPYNISSRFIEWLLENNLRAVLCLQKDFVDRLIAKAGNRNYSRISILSNLNFRIIKIMDVDESAFYPKPKVKSSIIYIEPLGKDIDKETYHIIELIMQHKKKKLRNAIIDSNHILKISNITKLADSIRENLRDQRVFKLEPDALVEVARYIKDNAERFK